MMQSVALTDSCQHDEDFVIVESHVVSDVELDDYDDDEEYDYCEDAYSAPSVVQPFSMDSEAFQSFHSDVIGDPLPSFFLNEPGEDDEKGGNFGDIPTYEEEKQETTSSWVSSDEEKKSSDSSDSANNSETENALASDDASVTSSKTNCLSNKKRRKQLRLAKKVAAAAAAAAVLSQISPLTRASALAAARSKKSARKATKKQVACATQSLASYKEEERSGNKASLL
jgi:hypothetical protein